MKRKLAGAVTLAAIGSMALAGCGGSDSNSSGGGDNGGSTTLKFVAAGYGNGPNSSNATKKYWEPIVKAFEKKNPDIKVDLTVIPWKHWTSQVQTMIQNKQYPDVLEGTYFASYAQEGLLYPASKVISDPSNLLPSMKEQGTYKGKQYGMPWTTSSRTLFYNEKLFDKAGISKPPTTWAELKSDAAKIKAKTGKTGFGLPLGSEEAQAETLLWFLGNGGGYVDSDGKWAINSSKNVEAFTFLNGLVKAGDTESSPGTKDRTDLWKQFAAGNIGMINGSPALIPIIEDGKKLTDSDWSSTAIVGKNGALKTTLGVCDNITAFKPNGHAAQIKKFMDFIYQDKYQIKFDKEYDLLPGTASAADKLKSDPVFGPFMKALPNAVVYPATNSAWPKVQTQVQNTIGTAIGGDPKQVLDQIQQVAESAS